MEMSASFVGSPFKEHKVTVDWRHAMNYAASLGDANPWYLDDEREGGIVAPPMLAVALTWPISKNIGENIIAEGFPAHLNKMQVHYTETLEWHRVMRPGDELTIQGVVAAITPHPAGTYFVVRYDATGADGAAVFTEYTGALLRNVKCPDSGQGRENLPKPPALQAASEPVWDKEISIHPLAAHWYDGGGDVHFPIHISPKFAHEVGLPGIILHGTATLSHAVTEIINREAGGDPRTLKSVSCRFSDMVVPGTSIHIKALATEREGNVTHLAFEVINATGRKAISRGYARLEDA